MKEKIAERKKEMLTRMIDREANLIDNFCDKYISNWYQVKPGKKNLRTYELEKELEDSSPIGFAAHIMHEYQDSKAVRLLETEYYHKADVDWLLIDHSLKLLKGYIEPILLAYFQKLWPGMKPEVKQSYLKDFSHFYKSLKSLNPDE